MVEFYAPWCGHCKALTPAYEAAAQRLKNNQPPMFLAKVDATVHGEVAKRFDVSGYPTLKVFKKGNVTPIEFDGARDENGIVEFMLEKGDPNYQPPALAVMTLTETNFTEWTQKEDLLLVAFIAPWCGHCKKLAPELEKAAQRLLKLDVPVPVAKIDGSLEKELAKSFNVESYPTMKIFRKNKVFEYGGPKDTAGIASYMESQVGDPSKMKKTLKEIKNFMNDDDVTIIGFFKDLQSDFYQTYQEAANHRRDAYKFGHTFDATAAEFYKVNPNSVVVFQAERFQTKYEPKWHVISNEDVTVEQLKSFWTKFEKPLVGVYDAKKGRYPESVRPLVLFFYTVDFSFDHRKNTQLWRNKIAAIANEFRDFTFAIANEDIELFKDFGFDESAEEMNIGILDSGDVRYPMEPMDEFDSDEIKSFLKSYKKGTLKQKIKSQPIPKKQKGPVKVVVGNNFDDIVMDESKDVLIEMYAPWCGHCKSFEPKYKELAQKFKSNKKLVFAKMDYTVNESPLVAYKPFSGYPSLFFAPANQKKIPVKYEGNRDLDDLEEFIKKHSVVAFKKDEL